MENVGIELSEMMTCPITCDAIQDPAFFGGRVYEKSAIQQALAARPCTCMWYVVCNLGNN